MCQRLSRSLIVLEFVALFIVTAALRRKGFKVHDLFTLWRFWRVHRPHQHGAIASAGEKPGLSMAHD
jgi:hypothetical protein